MTIHRYEVTDAEWAIIEPMLPKHHMGRPQKDLRAHFNGILWIARSGAR
ncbi:MAG TPA: transposase, partial [Candidatus Faecalibacterium gallistercoris]|nr:transposase [Candidatus Faecalibacterium gallistercoris]